MSGDCFHGELGPAKEDGGWGRRASGAGICAFRESKREDDGTSVTPGSLTGFAHTWNNHRWPVALDWMPFSPVLHPSARNEKELDEWSPISTLRSRPPLWTVKPWAGGIRISGDIVEHSCHIRPGHLHRLHLFGRGNLWCFVNPLTFGFSCPVWLI